MEEHMRYMNTVSADDFGYKIRGIKGFTYKKGGLINKVKVILDDGRQTWMFLREAFELCRDGLVINLECLTEMGRMKEKAWLDQIYEFMREENLARHGRERLTEDPR